uniref:Secreted protein n=1 Tax=Haemonchus contortus TaxID=6289 RepID=A0A7I4YKS0_HAECO
MNPITLVATLCLAYSVAGYFACLTDGKFSFDLFGDIEKPHRDLLTRFLNRTFDDGDLVLEYKVDSRGYDGGVYMKFPSVILRNVC